MKPTHVIVHSREQALQTQHALPDAIILNAPYSMDVYGLGYFHAFFEGIELAMLDVNDNPALAMEAMKLGFKHILFSGDEALFEKLESIADQQDTLLIHTPPDALDLGMDGDIKELLEARG